MLGCIGREKVEGRGCGWWFVVCKNTFIERDTRRTVWSGEELALAVAATEKAASLRAVMKRSGEQKSGFVWTVVKVPIT